MSGKPDIRVGKWAKTKKKKPKTIKSEKFGELYLPKFEIPMGEKISEALWHEKLIDLGIEQEFGFLEGPSEQIRKDQYLCSGCLSPPNIFEIHSVNVKHLARVPHFILQQFADACTINLHIGITDYIHRGPLSRFQYDAMNREWKFIVEQKLYLPPHQNIYVRLAHPEIRTDVEPFWTRVELHGMMGREVC